MTEHEKALRERLEHDLELAMYGGWPPGYEPGKGFPQGLRYEDIAPARTSGTWLNVGVVS